MNGRGRKGRERSSTISPSGGILVLLALCASAAYGSSVMAEESPYIGIRQPFRR